MVWHITTFYPSPFTPQSGRTYVARGEDVRLETRLIQGLVFMTRYKNLWTWASGLCGNCASVFASITFIASFIDFLVFWYDNDNDRCRRFFGFIVSKCYLFRCATLSGTSLLRGRRSLAAYETLTAIFVPEQCSCSSKRPAKQGLSLSKQTDMGLWSCHREQAVKGASIVAQSPLDWRWLAAVA